MNHEKVYKVIFASTIGTNVIYFVAKGETILVQGVPKNRPFMVLSSTFFETVNKFPYMSIN